MINKQNILEIGNNKYDLEKVKKIGASGPIINVSEDQLNDFNHEEFKVNLITSFPIVDIGAVIFYKQNGKYTVLLGKQSILGQKVKSKFNGEYNGHLISSVALKKAKLELIQ